MEQVKENVRRTVKMEFEVYDWLLKKTNKETTLSDVMLNIIKEYVYNDNFNAVTDYIFNTVSLDGCDEQVFFNAIASMAYNGRFDVIPLSDEIVENAIKEAKTLANKQ